jgi:hypothetical protein
MEAFATVLEPKSAKWFSHVEEDHVRHHQVPLHLYSFCFEDLGLKFYCALL